MGDIDGRLRELLERRRNLPGSIAVMETLDEASTINRHLCELEILTMRLAACWDGEFDPIGAFSQMSYLHEKAERAEQAARWIREAIERVKGWESAGAEGVTLASSRRGFRSVRLAPKSATSFGSAVRCSTSRPVG